MKIDTGKFKVTRIDLVGDMVLFFGRDSNGDSCDFHLQLYLPCRDFDSRGDNNRQLRSCLFDAFSFMKGLEFDIVLSKDPGEWKKHVFPKDVKEKNEKGRLRG